MKRRPPGRRPNEEQPSDSEEEAAALGKRARTVPHYASGDSEGDSGDSQSDSELSSSDEVRGALARGGGGGGVERRRQRCLLHESCAGSLQLTVRRF